MLNPLLKVSYILSYPYRSTLDTVVVVSVSVGYFRAIRATSFTSSIVSEFPEITSFKLDLSSSLSSVMVVYMEEKQDFFLLEPRGGGDFFQGATFLSFF